MQFPPNISTALYNALALIDPRLTVLVELYTFDSIPGVDGFDPVDAVLRVSNKTTTFLSLSYPRYLQSPGRVNRTMTEKFNSVSVDLDNADRTMAAFVLNNPLEGMLMVIRLISRAVTATTLLDSFVVFTGKCEKTFDATFEKVTISAKQYIGSIDEEVPWRTFDIEDEEGRLVTDVLFEGFPYKQTNVTVQYDERVPRGGFLGLIGFKKTVVRTLQYTSQREAKDDVAVPLILGRASAKLIPITSVDIGGAINTIAAAGEGPIKTWFDQRVLNAGYNGPFIDVQRLGYPGGTNDQFPVTTIGHGYVGNGYYSKTAWTAYWVNGADISLQEDAPEGVAIIMGSIIDVPDTSGDFVLDDWSDNPAFLTRFVLTHPRIFNLNSAFINDPVCIDTACYCDSPVLDETNGELIYLPDIEIGRYGTLYRRYRSTSLFTPEYFKHYYLNDPQDPLPELTLPEAVFYDQSVDELPTIEDQTLVRRRFSTNLYLLEKVKSADFLFKQVFPTFRGYLAQNARGKLDIKCRRPAHHTIIRSASIVGATQIAVNNVLPWSTDLTGKVIVGNDLLTSEVRAVSSIAYTAVANSITLTVTGNLTPSGATFSGGSGVAPATASVTVTGLGTLTVTIDGRSVSYETVAADNTSTAAAMLAQFLKADTTFQTYIKTTWNPASPTVISFQSKIGFLNLASPALAHAHNIAEQVLRIQMSFADGLFTPADLIASNMLEGTFRWPISSRQSSVNKIEGVYIDAPQDFRQQPIRTRDQDHIDQVGRVLPSKLALAGVDNYSQAKRLENSELAELRDLDFFMQHSSDRRAMLLEEGDLICNTHASGGFRNVALRIEEVTLDLSRMTVDISARRYSTSAYSDEAAARIVPIPTTLGSGISYPPPDIAFNDADFPPDGLIQTTASLGITSVRGGAIFGVSLYAQIAKVSLKRPGETVFTQITTITPDADFKAVFEFIASTEGVYTVQLEVCFSGPGGTCNPTLVTETITVTFGALGVLLTEEGGILLTEAGDYLALG